MDKGEILLAPPVGAPATMVAACKTFNAFADNHGGYIEKAVTLAINGEPIATDLEAAYTVADSVVTATETCDRTFDLAVVTPNNKGRRVVVNGVQGSETAWAMVFDERLNPGHANLSNMASSLARQVYAARLNLQVAPAPTAEDYTAFEETMRAARQQRRNVNLHNLGFIATTRTGLPYLRPRQPKIPRPYRTIAD